LRLASALVRALRPWPALLRPGLFRRGPTRRAARSSKALPEQPWRPRGPCGAISTVANCSPCRPRHSAQRDASGWLCRTRHSARRGVGTGWSRQGTAALQRQVGISMCPLSWRTRTVGAARTLATGSSAPSTQRSAFRCSGSGALMAPASYSADQKPPPRQRLVSDPLQRQQPRLARLSCADADSASWCEQHQGKRPNGALVIQTIWTRCRPILIAKAAGDSPLRNRLWCA